MANSFNESKLVLAVSEEIYCRESLRTGQTIYVTDLEMVLHQGEARRKIWRNQQNGQELLQEARDHARDIMGVTVPEEVWRSVYAIE